MEAVKTWFGLGVSLGAFAVLGWVVHWYWNRLRWHWFQTRVRAWAREETLFDDLSEEEWKSLAALTLSKAEFTPAEVKSLLDLAVLVAKGRTSLELRGRIQFGEKGEN